MWLYFITFLMTLTAAQETTPLFTVNPQEIIAGLTETLSIACLQDMSDDPTLAMIISVTLSHATTNESDFNVIARASRFEGVTQTSNETIQLKGAIEDEGSSYVEVTMEMPEEKDVGVYKCEVDGLNKKGKPVSFVSTETVALMHPTLKLILEELSKLKKKYSTLDYLINKALDQSFETAEEGGGHQSFEIIDVEGGDQGFENFKEGVDNITSEENKFITILNSLKTSLLLPSEVFLEKRYWLTRSPVFYDHMLAEDFCASFNGCLMHVDSSEEFDFIRAFLVNFASSFDYVVFGGTNVTDPNIWNQTASQTELDAIFMDEIHEDKENCHCLAFKKDADWHMTKRACSSDFTIPVAFVCEIPL